ncbi:MAG: METTL5 family protein [Promethearchaeota archaeon]
MEQYCIDATCAVDIVYFAGFEFDDINDKLVFDLGAGTGRLSISSAYLRAKYVLSIDIDWNAINILKKNVKNLELDHIIFPICADIKFFEISKELIPKNLEITTIMNPPFGIKKRMADRIFLEKAFSFSNVIYSIHLAGETNYKFVSNYAKNFNWKIDNVLPFNMVLEKSFQFHTKKRKRIFVDVYRFVKKKN